MKSRIKKVLNMLNEKYFFKKYKNEFKYINQKVDFKSYIVRFILIFIILNVVLSIIFTSIFNTMVLSFIITIFYINEILLNVKKLNYENYILSQLTIYISQMSMLINYNNVYSSIKEVINYLDQPLNNDLLEVIENIDSGKNILESFNKFNEKYNNKIVTLFNQTLELFDEHGNSDANTVLHIISEEMNMLKIKKDRYLKYKKEWRVNFYVVVFLCLFMPVILKMMIPTIYGAYMNSFGKWVMTVIFIINTGIIKKIEAIYRNQTIGEGGSK